MPQVLVGNTAERLKNGKAYKWTFYVRGDVKFVDYVDVGLHPTFAVPIRTLTGPVFKLNSQGWGTFPMLVAIFWKGGGSLVMEWQLQFRQADAHKALDIPERVVAAAAKSPHDKGAGGGGGGAKQTALLESFRSLDRNGDGTLDIKELHQLMAHMESDISGLEIRKLFASMDRNGDGRVSTDEFVAYLCTSPPKARITRAVAAAAPIGRAREILRSGKLRLLSAHWLCKQPAGSRIRRCQDLPQHAFVPPQSAELLLSKDRGVVVISYAWLMQEHPDPHGFHMEKLLALLKCLGCAEKRGLDSDVGVFWDFASLPQPPRSEAEDEAFRAGLQAINLLYGGKRSLVVQLKSMPDPPFDGMNCTPYDQRGWCVFEEAVSSILKDSDKLWDLSRAAEPLLGGGSQRDVKLAAIAARGAPWPPKALEEQLRSLAFTNRADREVVAGIYASFFEETCASATCVTFSSPWNWWTSQTESWGPAEAARLAEVLPAFHSCQNLSLHDHDELGSGDEEAERLALSLSQLRHLRQLLLSDCGFGDGFLRGLLGGDGGLLQLRHLWIGGRNSFSEAGLQALANGLEQLPSLFDLRLPAALSITQGASKLTAAWMASGRAEVGLQWD